VNAPARAIAARRPAGAGGKRRLLAAAAAACLALNGAAAGPARGQAPPTPRTAPELAWYADGWTAEVIAEIDQSYAGWDVEIGDGDNDGRTDILTSTTPDSRLYLFTLAGEDRSVRLLADQLAGPPPGMALGVRVVDLDGDGRREIIAGTGQEDGTPAMLHLLRADGSRLVSRPLCNLSAYTHGLATADLDGDGVQEIISAFCGGGEVVRYDADPQLGDVAARKVLHLSGSGEDAQLADVDNDGRLELLVVSAFREGQARVQIHELDAGGDPEPEPRLVLDGFDGRPCFYASLTVGDVDNDGRNDLVVGWKREQAVNRATLLGYRVDHEAVAVYEFDRETADLDLAYFEKMMIIADADNDGRNEMIVTTRGDGGSEGITSERLGHVYRYDVYPEGGTRKELLVDFSEEHVESSWPAVGDVDGDGRNEIILATGSGDRRLPGRSWLLLLRRP
jgi:hypothetical protein